MLISCTFEAFYDIIDRKILVKDDFYMNDITLDLLHRVYQESLAESGNILAIVENYYEKLLKLKVPDEDVEFLDDFIDGIRGCLQYRRKTFVITNFITEFSIALMYIIIWLNNQGHNMDVHLFSRRKSLESDLTKILKKTLSSKSEQNSSSFEAELSANIRDRFGIRCIILNDESIQYIYKIFDAIVGILGGKKRMLKSQFIDWIKDSSSITSCDKSMVNCILDTPFAITHVKDYIKDPKSNGYRTLQFTMEIQMYSDILPGCQLEIQIRDQEMHEQSISGPACHTDYKKRTPDERVDVDRLNRIFTVDDFSGLKITGFSSAAYSYDDSGDSAIGNPHDFDGIHSPKVFFNRRVASGLIVL